MASCWEKFVERYPRWTKLELAMLAGSALSSIVLIITLYTVWYPYLVTHDFVWAQCYPQNPIMVGVQYCSQSTESCYTVPPDVIANLTFPTAPYTGSTTTSTHQPTGPPQTSATTTSTAAASTTAPDTVVASTEELTTVYSTSLTSSEEPTSFGTTGALPLRVRRRRRAALTWTPPPDTEACPWFPCARFMTAFSTYYFVGIGQLYESYDQLHSGFVNCSISSCSSDNEENVARVQAWFDEYINRPSFTCYVNFKNSKQILTSVYRSYSAAINSILWPILALIGFGVALICLRVHTWLQSSVRDGRHGRRERHPGSYTDPSYTVNYVANPTRHHPGEMEFHPAAAAAAEASGGFEKNPAMFQDAFGASPSPWMFAYPPQYDEVSGAAAVGGTAAAAAMGLNYDQQAPPDGTFDNRTVPDDSKTGEQNTEGGDNRY